MDNIVLEEQKNENNYKTLKYKPHINNNYTWVENNKTNNIENLEKFLENEKVLNAAEPWNKLDKTAKIKKLVIFSQKYSNENNLSNTELSLLINFLKDCLDRKKLQRVKDVKYDLETGEVKEIPALTFNKNNNNFTLRVLDKKTSTIRGLAPKKKQGTIKKTTNDSDSENDEN